jgi:hypothetical protein
MKRFPYKNLVRGFGRHLSTRTEFDYKIRDDGKRARAEADSNFEWDTASLHAPCLTWPGTARSIAVKPLEIRWFPQKSRKCLTMAYRDTTMWFGVPNDQMPTAFSLSESLTNLL